MTSRDDRNLKAIEEGYRSLTGRTDATLNDALKAVVCYVGENRSIDDLSYDELEYTGRNFITKLFFPPETEHRIVKNALFNSVDYRAFLRCLENNELQYKNGYLFYLP